MIILSKTHFSNISQHALKCFPNECCGALFGDITDDKKYVKSIRELENNWNETNDENKTRRFKITTQDYMQCEKIADSSTFQLLGFYHSHPDHLPIPSSTDLKYAWPFFSYPIISLTKNKINSIKSYVLNPDIHDFIEEQLKIL